jgi:type II secretory pathway pseudopilin PulG
MKEVRAFTILELLVSIAVLAIILVMLVQVVNGLLQSTRTQSQKMDSSAAARRVLDVMAMDLQNAVVGENAAILAPTAAGSNLFTLLTSRRGPTNSSTPRFLAVSYAMTNSQISRSYGSVPFTQTNLIDPSLGTATVPVEPLAKGILAIQVRAITETTNFPITSAASANWATNRYNGFPVQTGYQTLLTRSPAFSSAFTNTTRALEIWIVAIDEQNAKLTSYKPTNPDPAAWRAEIDGAGIPAQAKASIRILNNTVPLP